MPGEHLTRFGEAHVAAHPLDENGAAALLESTHHLRHRGLGVPERGSGPSEAALVAMARITRSPAASIMVPAYDAQLSSPHALVRLVI